MFEAIVPSRYITFTIPNPLQHLHHFTASLLRVAVLDSPAGAASAAVITAAMLVPLHRESDWIFSTESGLLQLLLTFPSFSRLVLIGNSPDSPLPSSYNPPLQASDVSVIEESLMPLLIALSPKEAFRRTDGVRPKIQFVSYEDEVIRSLVLETIVGDCVGEMLVEDVELEVANGGREFRRRLRFRRTPNLIQSQVRILPDSIDSKELELGLDAVKFRVDNEILVHPYLTPMVAGLSVSAQYLDEQIQSGIVPRALCLGVGGGALLSFMNARLGFEVSGVEEDEVVLRIGRKYFGLKDNESNIRIHIGDALQMITNPNFDVKFDSIMVDLDSSDAAMGTSAPPLEFLQRSNLFAAKKLLSDNGVLIVNVIPPHQQFYEMLMNAFREVFEELFEIDVADKENVVVIATVSRVRRVSCDSESSFLRKLKSVVSGSYIDRVMVVSSSADGD